MTGLTTGTQLFFDRLSPSQLYVRQRRKRAADPLYSAAIASPSTLRNQRRKRAASPLLGRSPFTCRVVPEKASPLFGRPPVLLPPPYLPQPPRMRQAPVAGGTWPRDCPSLADAVRFPKLRHRIGPTGLWPKAESEHGVPAMAAQVARRTVIAGNDQNIRVQCSDLGEFSIEAFDHLNLALEIPVFARAIGVEVEEEEIVVVPLAAERFAAWSPRVDPAFVNASMPTSLPNPLYIG